MIFIREATKKEKFGNKQSILRKLKARYNKEVVYMPYGKDGQGFYLRDKIKRIQ